MYKVIFSYIFSVVTYFGLSTKYSYDKEIGDKINPIIECRNLTKSAEEKEYLKLQQYTTITD